MKRKNKLCNDCRVNEVEYEEDTECAWCRERRRKEEGESRS
jgi:hypothetical protein